MRSLRVALAVAGLGSAAALAVGGRPGGFMVAALLGLAGFIVAAGELAAELAPFARVRAACAAASLPVALAIPLVLRASGPLAVALGLALAGLQVPPVRARRPRFR